MYSSDPFRLRMLMFAVGASATFVTSLCSGQGLIYYDADLSFVNGTDNLSAADGSSLFDTFNSVFSSPAQDDLWDIRGTTDPNTMMSDNHGARPAGSVAPYGAGEEQSVFTSGGRGPEEARELVQAITGLNANTSFDIYAVYWSATNANWAVRAGLTSNPGGNTLFSRTGAAIGGEASVAGTLAESAFWSTPPGPNNDAGLYSEGNRVMLVGKVGTAQSTAGGQLNVFIDDASTAQLSVDSNNRTFYDGLAIAPAGSLVVAQATLDRDTGAFNFFAPGDIASYSISSASGSLDATQWNSIATGSNSSVDTDPWAEDSSVDTLLEESETPAVDGASLNGALNLGSIWRNSPFEDLALTVTLSDATELEIPIEYTGTSYELGDLDTDRDIDIDDYQILVSNLHAQIDDQNPASDSQLEQYLQGDLNGDTLINYADIVQFQSIFAAANPGATLSLSRVPEPKSLGLLGGLLAVIAFGFKSKLKMRLALILAALAMIPATASNAQELFYNVQFGNQAAQTANYAPELVNVTLAPGLVGSSAEDIKATETFNDEISNLVFANDQPESNPITGGPLRVTQNPGPDIDESEFNMGYFLIEVSPFLGTFNLTNLTFEAQRATGGTSQRGFELFVETNGSDFDFNTSTQLLDVDVEPTNRNDGPTTYDVDLTGLEFQGIDSVAFRFYHTAINTGGMEFGNISLFGQEFDASQLSLQVDRGTGEVTILNDSDVELSLDYYEIRSPEGDLSLANWTSLDDQDLEPDPFSAGWDEAGGSSNSILSEVRGIDEGNQVVPATSGSLSFGNAFRPGGAENLSFRYAVDGSSLLQGTVNYVGVAPEGLLGDFNDDGVVNIADYTVWRDNLGASDTVLPAGSTNDGSGTVDAGDYATWKANFGNSLAPASSLTSQRVPEPSSTVCIVLGFAMASLLCRRPH